MALLVTILGSRNIKINSKILKCDILRVLTPIEIPTEKDKTCILLRKFHHRTNLTQLLVTIFGSRNKNTNSKI
jgi:hypothetical protein